MRKPLHPLTMWIWAILLSIGAVALDNVWVAVAIIVFSAVLVRIRNDDSPWSSTFWWALRLGIFIIAFRAIVGVLIGVPIPGTVLFSIPRLDLPSWMPGIRIGGAVTRERLSSSVHEGMIIATLIALFGAATSLTIHHKLLRVLPVFIYEIGITLVIATSVFPQLASSFQRIRKAQKLRGIEGAKFRNLALPLLEQSLTRSLQLAESMDSRGYGTSRKRSRYRPEKWRRRDSLIVITSIFLLMAMVSA